MAATETWPAKLPRPTFEGYSIEPLDGVDRTEMEQGEARQTQNFTQVPDRRTVRWHMTQDQCAIFESWFAFKADRGAEWFNVELMSGLGLISVEARFVGSGSKPYRLVPKRGGLNGARWECTSTFEVRQPPILTEEALDVLLVEDLAGLESATGALHALVNETLPGPGGWT